MARTDPHAHLIQFWCDTYERHVGTKYPFMGGKDGKAIKDLRAIYSDDQLRTFMAAFFEIDDEFIQQSGYSLGVFRGCLPKVITYLKRQREGTPSRRQQTPKNLQGLEAWIRKRAASE